MPTAEIFDWRLQLRCSEAELFNQLRCREFFSAGFEGGFFTCNQAEDSLAIELFEFFNFLREGCDFHGLAEFYATACWCEQTFDKPQQSGLAGTVDANQAKAIARAESPGDIAKKFLRWSVFARGGRVTQVFNVDDVFAESGGCQLLQLEPVARLGLVCNELFCGVNAKFWFCCSGRSAAAKPGQLFAHQVAATGLAGCR